MIPKRSVLIVEDHDPRSVAGDNLLWNHRESRYPFIAALIRYQSHQVLLPDIPPSAQWCCSPRAF